ncbi:MAG: hypothetical protein K9J13_00360 [Saprospiraceae bacterium]|nr:hypothetical protein [Saprospiraceae bacterium]
MEKMLQEISDNVKNGLKISLVFGEPIETQGKTIIPVSKVAGGFGGGSGESPKIPCKDDDEDCQKENRAHGQGGGGGLHNEAIGVFEITPNYTRFIPAVQFKHIIIMMGMILGFIWKLSRRKKKK